MEIPYRQQLGIALGQQFSQRPTWPPSAAVRQRSIADMTFIWPRLTWPALACPCRKFNRAGS